MESQRCETCKWWNEQKPYKNGGQIGVCEYPMESVKAPSCIHFIEEMFMWADEGGDCPCYERKDG